MVIEKLVSEMLPSSPEQALASIIGPRGSSTSVIGLFAISKLAPLSAAKLSASIIFSEVNGVMLSLGNDDPTTFKTAL
jgi:hypothetical protein